MEAQKYKRVLIKISGEALAGDKHFGLNFDGIGPVCDVIKKCSEEGCEIGIVVGGGNFWRGVKDGGGKMERTRADHMGMLATTINALALQDALEQRGVDVRVQTAIEMNKIALVRPVIWKRAASSSSAAAPAVRSSRLIPQRCCVRLRSARTLSCWRRTLTAFTIPIRRSIRTRRSTTSCPTWMF